MISRESSEFRRVIGLDKGTEDGIEVGDVVVASGGALAGRVTEVGPDSATVVLLTDARSTVIGQLSSTPPPARSWASSGACWSWTRSTRASRSTLGDEVVTAGIELGGGVRSPYPKGLLIGQVVDVRRDANDVVQTAYLRPGAPTWTGSSTCWSSPTTRAACRRSRSSRSTARPGGDAARRRTALPRPTPTPKPTTSRRARPPSRRPGWPHARRSAGRATALLPFARDEGHRARRRDRDAAVPADDRHQQAPAADLRPADDLLPDRDAGRHGHPRGAWSSSAARASATWSSCSATAAISGST